ncbi:MAG: calcium-binding protein, partial [Halodesulfovibrio sp.]|uniref:calcium-binding protein n=1 Tax=Halodesulfovibrio sp. TaxID=1912772 RepID=UPI00359EEBE0
DDTITTGGNHDIVDGGSGADIIDAGAGNNTITGGLGDDTIYGGANGDTYVFNLGDGHDTIYDNVEGTTGSYFSGDKLAFGAGITEDDLIFTEDGQDQLITFRNSAADSIRIKNVKDKNYLRMEYVTDSGSNSEIGTNGNDIIRLGSGNNTVTGGHGDDTIYGGIGDDTYVFNIGDGHDTIYDNSEGTVGSYSDKLT